METSLMNLKGVTSKVLEEMFFMYEETEPTIVDLNFQYCAYVKLSHNTIQLLASKQLGEKIAKNFLGIDNVDDNEIKDILKEIVNMILGNYIGLYMKDNHEAIPIPQISEDLSDFSIDKENITNLFYDGLPLCLQFN